MTDLYTIFDPVLFWFSTLVIVVLFVAFFPFAWLVVPLIWWLLRQGARWALRFGIFAIGTAATWADFLKGKRLE